MPVPGGQLGEKRQGEVAEQSRQGHLLQGAGVQEAIRFGVVVAVVHQRREQHLHARRVHLAVAVDLDDDVRPLLEGALHAGDRGATDAAALRVADHLDARIAHGFRGGRGAIGAAIVDHDDEIDERRHAAQHVADVQRFVQSRHDGGNTLSLIHHGIPYSQPRSAPEPSAMSRDPLLRTSPRAGYVGFVQQVNSGASNGQRLPLAAGLLPAV